MKGIDSNNNIIEIPNHRLINIHNRERCRARSIISTVSLAIYS